MPSENMQVEKKFIFRSSLVTQNLWNLMHLQKVKALIYSCQISSPCLNRRQTGATLNKLLHLHTVRQASFCFFFSSPCWRYIAKPASNGSCCNGFQQRVKLSKLVVLYTLIHMHGHEDTDDEGPECVIRRPEGDRIAS